MLRSYWKTLYQVLVQPIYFYTFMPAGEWSDKPITFAGVTAWILAALASLVVFFTQLAPIGATLFEKVSGYRMIIILPVAALLAFMFYLITVMIIGGVMMALVFALFYVLGLAIHASSYLMGGRGEALKSIKASLYSSASLLAMLFPILLIFLTKRGILDFTNFRIGYNMFYCFAVLYLYGLFAIISRKVYKVSKASAFIAALLPLLILILLGIIMSQLVLPEMQPWLT